MKTFKDLVFNKHFNFPSFATQAKMFFPNGYGISVVTGEFAYSNRENPYECGVLKGNSDEWSLTYDTPITNDVIGYCNEEKVTEIMKQIQEL